jgi:hypothetical protein
MARDATARVADGGHFAAFAQALHRFRGRPDMIARRLGEWFNEYSIAIQVVRDSSRQTGQVSAVTRSPEFRLWKDANEVLESELFDALRDYPEPLEPFRDATANTTRPSGIEW